MCLSGLDVAADAPVREEDETDEEPMADAEETTPDDESSTHDEL